MNADVDVGGVLLRTERLLLRPWGPGDLDDLFAFTSQAAVMKNLGQLPHADREEARAMLARFIAGRNKLALEFGGRAVGSLGIERYAERSYPELTDLSCRELSFMLSPSCWGLGLMTEAVREVLRWLFEEKGLDAVLCGHFVSNARSARVQEKCGFVHFAYRKYMTKWGTEEEDELNILTREEWLRGVGRTPGA